MPDEAVAENCEANVHNKQVKIKLSINNALALIGSKRGMSLENSRERWGKPVFFISIDVILFELGTISTG